MKKFLMHYIKAALMLCVPFIAMAIFIGYRGEIDAQGEPATYVSAFITVFTSTVTWSFILVGAVIGGLINMFNARQKIDSVD